MIKFVNANSNSPIIIEIFTDKDVDQKQMNAVLNSYRPATEKKLTAVASKLPDSMKRQIKKMLGRD